MDPSANARPPTDRPPIDRPPIDRPRVKAHLRPLRRGADSVQFGVDPNVGAVVLTGLSRAEIDLIGRLDGSVTTARLTDLARSRGVSRERWLDLLAELGRRGLLAAPGTPDLASAGPPAWWPGPAEDAELLADVYGSLDANRFVAHRGRHVVGVAGRGTIPTAIVAALRHDGVGTVHDGYAVDALSQPGADVDSGSPGPARPGLVVLPSTGTHGTADARFWQEAGVPTLPVVIDGVRARVGPLLGGPGMPCPTCVELRRSDRDPAWPTLLAQLEPARTLVPPTVEAESTIGRLAVAMSVAVVHAVLDGRPPPLGVSIEVALPLPRTVVRHWPVHPRCPRHGRPGGNSAPGAPGVPGGGLAAAS